ncbi:TetR family transcriptional regulator [Actinoplanes sp. NBRC 101535]|nr:TetR family transcriptional regulator [Actinoplanes sp. NBRC 101535]
MRVTTTRRAEYAAATKRAIEQAAHDLFSRQGFKTTTVDMIARQARVAPATVYAVAGGKQGLLRTVIASATTSPETEEIKQRLADAPDAAGLVRYLTHQTRLKFADWHDVMRVVAETASQDPAVADALRLAAESRREGFRRAAGRLHDLGALHDGLTVDRAADIIWFYLDNASYFALTDTNGWPLDDAEAFLHDQLRGALLRTTA